VSWKYTYPKAVIHDMHVDRVDWRPSWSAGKPILVVNHITVTCGALFPGAGRFNSEGIGSTFGIRHDGTVCQYTDLDRGTWHARDCSHYGPGIEYDARPVGSSPDGPFCDITAAQLEAGAELCAWLCKTFGIPAKRSTGVTYTPGLKCHTDGLEDGGAKWDSDRHWDAPWKSFGDPIANWISPSQRTCLDRSPWTAQKFVARVAELLNPPGGEDLTEAETKELIQKQVLEMFGVQSESDLTQLEASLKGRFDMDRKATSRRKFDDPKAQAAYDRAWPPA